MVNNDKNGKNTHMYHVGITSVLRRCGEERLLPFNIARGE